MSLTDATAFLCALRARRAIRPTARRLRCQTLLRSLPKDMHPMTQFSIGLLAAQTDSKFASAYQVGVRRPSSKNR